MERGHLIRILLRRSFSQPTVEGDKRELFGQGRPQAKDSVAAWATGISSDPQNVFQGIATSRFSFIGTVAATDMSRATDSREAGRMGIFGSGLSYGGGYGRVASESIGRDVNPIGRGDGAGYLGGQLRIGGMLPTMPFSAGVPGSGNSINNSAIATGGSGDGGGPMVGGTGGEPGGSGGPCGGGSGNGECCVGAKINCGAAYNECKMEENFPRELWEELGMSMSSLACAPSIGGGCVWFSQSEEDPVGRMTQNCYSNCERLIRDPEDAQWQMKCKRCCDKRAPRTARMITECCSPFYCTGDQQPVLSGQGLPGLKGGGNRGTLILPPGGGPIHGGGGGCPGCGGGGMPPVGGTGPMPLMSGGPTAGGGGQGFGGTWPGNSFNMTSLSSWEMAGTGGIGIGGGIVGGLSLAELLAMAASLGLAIAAILANAYINRGGPQCCCGDEAILAGMVAFILAATPILTAMFAFIFNLSIGAGWAGLGALALAAAALLAGTIAASIVGCWAGVTMLASVCHITAGEACENCTRCLCSGYGPRRMA